jgi:hypothetical protein
LGNKDVKELRIAMIAGVLGILVSAGTLSLWNSMPQPVSEEARKTFLLFANPIWPAWHTMIDGTVPSNPMTLYYRYYVPWVRTPLINGLIYSVVALVAAVCLRVAKSQMIFARSPKVH